MLCRHLAVYVFTLSQSLALAFQFQASSSINPRRTLSSSPILQSSSCKKRSCLHLAVQVSDAMSTIDAFYKSSPYEAAFFTCGIKASAADFLAQTRELQAASLKEEKTDEQIEFERNLAFILYGCLYQGIAQYYIYNILFPLWFGQGHDLTSVIVKVAFDMTVISSPHCIPHEGSDLWSIGERRSFKIQIRFHGKESIGEILHDMGTSTILHVRNNPRSPADSIYCSHIILLVDSSFDRFFGRSGS